MTDQDLKQAAGSLIIGGFEGETAPTDLRERVCRGELGGVILFRRNVSSLEQVSALIASIQAANPSGKPPLIVSVDQEGGRVARLRGLVTDVPPMATLGRLEDERLCEKVALMMGRELVSLGFNTNYAPVMDVNTRPNNPVIGDRSFSDDPNTVARLGCAFARGLRCSGIIPCAKHFPGHGDTSLNSHIDLPVIEHAWERLEAVELVPFRTAIRDGVPLIMTAHLVVTVADSDRPATLSGEVLTELLRRRMGFEGVVVSDDLQMAAVADRYAPIERVTFGLFAGVDLFLFCHSLDEQWEAYEVLLRLASESSRNRECVLAAASRVRSLRTKHACVPEQAMARWQDVVRCEEHLALIDEIHRRLEPT